MDSVLLEENKDYLIIKHIIFQIKQKKYQTIFRIDIKTIWIYNSIKMYGEK